MRSLPLLAFFLMVRVAAAGEAPAVDKSGYTLFHPTPRAAMRELTTDRPDKTESPYTVDAGHFQLEMDLANFTYDRHNPERADVRREDWSFANTNLKVGLLNNVDLQLVIPIYNESRTDDRAATITRLHGFGDLTVRLKINLWGNDEGKTAFGLLPFVKIPTNTGGLGNRAVEGGLILPLTLKLPHEWEVGLMTEVDFNEDEGGSGYHAEWINSITVSHAIVGQLSGYVEFFSQVSAERAAPWIGTIDLGLTYQVTDNFQVDAGVNLGVTRAADDVNPFVGLSWRY